MPAVLTTAASAIASTYSADSTPVIRASAAATARSSSSASSTLASVGTPSQLVAPQVELDRLDAVGLGQRRGTRRACRSRRCPAPRRGPRRARRVVEGAGVGEALPVVARRPARRRRPTRPTTATRSRPRRPGSRCRGERTTIGLDLLAGSAGRRPSARPEVAPTARPMRRRSIGARSSDDGHAAVPPTVSSVTRSVGTPSPTGTPWPSLPHVPGPPMAKSLPTASICREHLGTVADEVALADRVGDLAVLDQVRLGHAEHEVAGGRVDLAAAELLRRRRPARSRRRCRRDRPAAGQQVGVGHAHHRQVLVALAPAVARPGPALLAAAQEVPHVVGEHAVLDEHVALGRRALVVDGQTAPLLGHGAVVDERDAGRGHLLAELAGEHRRALGDEVGLEAVAARLVEQHAAAARPDDDRHRAGRGGPGRQLGERLPGGPAGQLLDVDRGRTARSRSCGRRSRSRSACRCRPDGHALHRRTCVLTWSSSASRPSLLATRMRRRLSPMRPLDLADRRRPRTRAASSARRSSSTWSPWGRRPGSDRRRRSGPARRPVDRRDRPRLSPPPPRARDGGRGLGRGAQAGLGEVGGVGEAGRVADARPGCRRPGRGPEVSSSTRPSSSRADDDRWSSTNTSAKSPPVRRAAPRTRWTTSSRSRARSSAARRDRRSRVSYRACRLRPGLTGPRRARGHRRRHRHRPRFGRRARAGDTPRSWRWSRRRRSGPLDGSLGTARPPSACGCSSTTWRPTARRATGSGPRPRSSKVEGRRLIFKVSVKRRARASSPPARSPGSRRPSSASSRSAAAPGPTAAAVSKRRPPQPRFDDRG